VDSGGNVNNINIQVTYIDIISSLKVPNFVYNVARAARRTNINDLWRPMEPGACHFGWCVLWMCVCGRERERERERRGVLFESQDHYYYRCTRVIIAIGFRELLGFLLLSVYKRYFCCRGL
jgi:hypothetical protein